MANRECIDVLNEHLVDLLLPDVISLIDVHYLPDVAKRDAHVVIAQLGLRYAQAKALVECLMEDKEFAALDHHLQKRSKHGLNGNMWKDDGRDRAVSNKDRQTRQDGVHTAV